MSASLSLTEAQVLGALRSVLLTYLGTIEIVRSEINRVAEPIGPDFIVMTPPRRERLSTNVAVYSDGFLLTPPQPGTVGTMQPTMITVQLDIHGPNSANNAQIVSTLFRDRVACELFAATGLAVQPLYADEPHQAPFEDAEQQTEFNWSIDVVLQANIIVTTPQDFAGEVNIGLLNVDRTYPP